MRLIQYLFIALVILLQVPFAAALPLPQAGVDARGIVESAEIDGIDEGSINQEIRDAIQKLVGQKFDQQAADDLVQRLQEDKPDFIATTRLLKGSQADRVKVVFNLERKNEEPGNEANVNSRYTVERVEVQGFDTAKLNSSIRDDMQKMVGEKLDLDKANQILNRIDVQLRPRYLVYKRIVKGTDRQHIAVIYEVKKVPWIPFFDLPMQRSKIVYHSKQNFSLSATADLVHDGNDNRLYVGLFNDQDILLERSAGFDFGFENARLGTDRLGFALRLSRSHEKWQPATVLAGPTDIYRNRTNFEPSVTFAFDPRARVTAGVSLNDIQMQYPQIHRANPNAVTASFAFDDVWSGAGDDKHLFDARYDFRAGNHKLSSDFIYTRHFVDAQYIYGHKGNQLNFKFLAGTISGNAPLFERFSLGNTSTLRGWNKFDIAPLGGNRVLHATLQYGLGGPVLARGRINNRPRELHPGFHIFYDAGVVGDRGVPMKARHSVGFGFGTADSSKFAIDLGVPIHGHGVMFMTGYRF